MASNHVIAAPVELPEWSTTPPAPPAGSLLMYSKTDDAVYQQTSAGVETKIGSGASGGRTFAFFAG